MMAELSDVKEGDSACVVHVYKGHGLSDCFEIEIFTSKGSVVVSTVYTPRTGQDKKSPQGES
jgi:hypothetical protein